MSWRTMIENGIGKDYYTTTELNTLKNTGLQKLVDDGLITTDEKTELTTLINSKLT